MKKRIILALRNVSSYVPTQVMYRHKLCTNTSYVPTQVLTKLTPSKLLTQSIETQSLSSGETNVQHVF